MSERTIKANGIELWTEDFGKRTDPALLLIMGASAQGIQWPESFIARLVDRSFYVIRYDNRDTGQSTCFDFAEAPYTLGDMAKDAVGLLDAYDVPRAHVAGASMGGMIAQTLVIEHPARVRSATIIMSSPLSGIDGGPDLPGPDPKWLENFMALAAAPLETAEQQIEMRAQLFANLAGRIPPDLEAIREVATREVARAKNFAAQNNHSLAIGASQPPDRRPLLANTRTPTLVIHGTDDPILPYAHGKAIAEAIPGSELITLEGAGHDLPESMWDTIVDGIVAVTRRAA
jgi:pimeloyl-ACP methyl ester carboxylesterase